MEEQAAEEPWYRRLWPFGRSSKTEPAPTAAPEQAPAPAVVAPPGRAGAQGERPAFAYDSPSKAIRTSRDRRLREDRFLGHRPLGHRLLSWCDARAGTGRRRRADPCTPVIEPEPVQVQPLQPEPVEEPRTLDARAAADRRRPRRPHPDQDYDARGGHAVRAQQLPASAHRQGQARRVRRGARPVRLPAHPHHRPHRSDRHGPAQRAPLAPARGGGEALPGHQGLARCQDRCRRAWAPACRW